MRISNKIATLEINPRGADSLKLSVEDNYRVRVGDYRIVYDIQDEVRIVSIIRIQHRKDAYR